MNKLIRAGATVSIEMPLKKTQFGSRWLSVFIFGNSIQFMFTKSIWNRGTCTLVRDQSNDTDQSFVNTKSRHKNAVVTLGVGATLAEVDINIAVFRRPRTANSFCFIDMESIYRALNLTQYEGYASRWVNKTYPKWLKDLKATFPGFNDEMFVHSLHHAEKKLKRNPKTCCRGNCDALTKGPCAVPHFLVFWRDLLG